MTIGIISAFHSGVDVVVEWKINSFFTLSESDGAFYCSPYFSFGGETWRLGIYPNGWSGSHSSGHVDLELCKDDSDRCIKQSFSLSLKTMKGEKYKEEHYTKDFDSDNCTHELNRFVPRYELTRRRSELMLDGVLIVICTMKHTTPARSAEEEASNAEVSKSDVPEAPKSEVSGSSQAGTKESISKWIKENNKEASKGKKRKMEEENDISDSAEYSTSDSDSDAAECSSDSDSGECCHKCPDCLDIVKKQKLLEELESQKERSEGEDFASGSSRNSQESKVLHDLKELFLKKEGCDVVLKIKGSEFPVHRLILRARSPVFASTFRHDMKENATGIVEIEDCNVSTFSDFLCFLYCGDIRIISQENVFDLFTAADKYQVLDLRAMCRDFMRMNMTVNTFCETISLALQHSETELIKLSTEYFKKNAPKIIVTVKWQTFLAENPTESNELFIKLLIPNSS